MGRWAQQQRRGGGDQVIASGFQVTVVTSDDEQQLLITFDRPIGTPALFGPSWQLLELGAWIPGDVATIVNATQIHVQGDAWPADISAGDQWRLVNGSGFPGVNFPQTGLVS